MLGNTGFIAYTLYSGNYSTLKGRTVMQKKKDARKQGSIFNRETRREIVRIKNQKLIDKLKGTKWN